MTSPLPLVVFAPPAESKIPTGGKRGIARVVGPGPEKQAERIGPRWVALARALDAERIVASEGSDESDPELVVVFDLAGTVEDFQRAVDGVVGLEFLNEYLEGKNEPDDDFYMADKDGPTTNAVQESLYVVMTNAKAVGQLIKMFESWKKNPKVKLPRGLAPFKSVFAQLRALRRWDASDRTRETGLIAAWEDEIAMTGQAQNTKTVEIELWFRKTPTLRAAAEKQVRDILAEVGADVVRSSIIGEIAYHALLVRIPIQQVRSAITNGAASMKLLTTDSVMFVSPVKPMHVAAPEASQDEPTSRYGPAPTGLPRIALLDGLPFANHEALRGRVLIDDPDELDSAYPTSVRHHGTAMASLLVHGDLSRDDLSLARPIYVRPILRPDPHLTGYERVSPDVLFTDVLHQAFKRMFNEDAGRGPVAPSVRIVNLSIGAQTRAFVRRLSPAARLLDWLAYENNVLIVVSAGNHPSDIQIDASSFRTDGSARDAATRAAHAGSRRRGILSPGEAINVLTVGAVHADHSQDPVASDVVIDLVKPYQPALYSSGGPGFRRSVKPEIHMPGGRALYVKPAPGASGDFSLAIAPATSRGPGHMVAAAPRSASDAGFGYCHGSSNAAALATRAASGVFDALERNDSDDNFPVPDPQYHPLLAKALLVHAASWGETQNSLAAVLGLQGLDRRRELTKVLGYGTVDESRLAVAAGNRAVILGGGSLASGMRHTYAIPKPEDLSAITAWRRLTFTLAWFTPVSARSRKYRGARLYLDTPAGSEMGARKVEAEHYSSQNGTCQHVLFEGTDAVGFTADESFSVHVNFRDDAVKHDRPIRYALVASVEVAEATSIRIHDQIRVRLQESYRARSASQVRSG